MSMWAEFSEESEIQQSDTETRYPNINKVRDNKYVVAFRERGKLIHVGIFDNIDAAIEARRKYKESGERSLKEKVTPLTKLPDLISYYFESTPPGINHALLKYAHIECGNDIGFLMNNPYFNIIEIP